MEKHVPERLELLVLPFPHGSTARKHIHQIIESESTIKD